MEEMEDGTRIIRGHGSVFNSLSEDLGGFREIIHTGAFDEALGKSDIRCLINHDANLILGRNTSGTLEVGLTRRAFPTPVSCQILAMPVTCP
jgi:HK97 family phage prohead protease